MASKFSSVFSATVTDATRSVVTVASTTGLLPGLLGYISNSGQTTKRIEVLTVPSSTTFTAKFHPFPADDNYDRGPSAGYPGNTSGSDLSAYTGGTGFVLFETQLVYDPALR